MKGEATTNESDILTHSIESFVTAYNEDNNKEEDANHQGIER